MRILFVSDAPWQASGYGQQTDMVTRAMVADGHEVYVYAPGALHEGEVPLAENLTVLSSAYGDDRWGNMSLPWHMERVQPDLVITWLDAQGLIGYGRDHVPCYMWAPIDSQPIPIMERDVLQRATKILVPSRWGQGILAEHGFDSEYVPCCIDLAALRIDPGARQRWRKRNGVQDDDWLIGMVGQNRGSPDRKGYAWAFDILKEFMGRHADVKAYLHTEPVGDQYAPNLTYLRMELGLLGRIDFPRQTGSYAWAGPWMAEMYNAFDVLLHCSLGEGFGVPILEAQACGTPVVVNAATAVTELSANGYQAQPSQWIWSTTITKWALPDVSNLLEQLERAYAARGDLNREAVREFTLPYGARRVYEDCWRPVLAAVAPPLDYKAGERKLLLGAGRVRKAGYTHHDRDGLYPDIDVAHDLTVFPWPWADSSWDYVEAVDVLEHLACDFTLVMDELWRITAPGGYLMVHGPEVGSWQHTADPTHVRGFTLDSFDYWTERGWGKTYPYTTHKWETIRKLRDESGITVVLRPLKPVAKEKQWLETSATT